MADRNFNKTKSTGTHSSPNQSQKASHPPSQDQWPTQALPRSPLPTQRRQNDVQAMRSYLEGLCAQLAAVPDNRLIGEYASMKAALGRGKMTSLVS